MYATTKSLSKALEACCRLIITEVPDFLSFLDGVHRAIYLDIMQKCTEVL